MCNIGNLNSFCPKLFTIVDNVMVLLYVIFKLVFFILQLLVVTSSQIYTFEMWSIFLIACTQYTYPNQGSCLENYENEPWNMCFFF